jgi:hypothetical protein
MALVVGKHGAHLEPAAADADALAVREASAPGGRGLHTGDGEAHMGDNGLTVTGASYFAPWPRSISDSGLVSFGI